VVVNSFNIMYQNLPGRIEENHKYLCQVRQSLSQDLDLVSLECQSVNYHTL
jgi:hypothetical protein